MTEMPQSFRSVQRVARKDHKCCECREVISAGATYQQSSGIWDGRPGSYRQCLECNDLINKASAAARSLDVDYPCFGDLHIWLTDFICMGFHGQEFLEGMAKDLGATVEQVQRVAKINLEEEAA